MMEDRMGGEVERVAQEDALGCQIAVCAMLLGVSYAQAKSFYPPFSTGGHGPHVLDNILVDQGYMIGRKFRHDASKRTDRTPWPPEPWADKHWCTVENEQGGHAVLMLHNGTVLDPATSDPKRLTDYGAVHFVALVAPAPRPAEPTEKLDYEAAWRALSDPLEWIQGNKNLSGYWGWNLADIVNDLIDRAYPGLRCGVQPGGECR